MRKILGIVAAFGLFSCTTVERDNCWDSRGINYRCQLSSSSVESLSSSSVESSGCSNVGSYSCPISGYRTVEINGQVWMAENLNCDVGVSFCYKRNTAYCNKYGRLYDGCTAMVICPSGWHLPSKAEWLELIDLAGGENSTNLRATSGWDDGDNGEDTYGFSALPGGWGDSDGLFEYAGSGGGWWGGSLGDDYATIIEMDDDIAVWIGEGTKNLFLYSVRCLQD